MQDDLFKRIEEMVAVYNTTISAGQERINLHKCPYLCRCSHCWYKWGVDRLSKKYSAYDSTPESRFHGYKNNVKTWTEAELTSENRDKINKVLHNH